LDVLAALTAVSRVRERVRIMADAPSMVEGAGEARRDAGNRLNTTPCSVISSEFRDYTMTTICDVLG
jgi:hypothetical protein